MKIKSQSKVENFDNAINLTEGLVLVCGKTGAGKTAFLNSLLIEQMYNRKRYKDAKKITSLLVQGGFRKLSLPPNHLCYSEYFCRSSVVGRKKYVTYECNAKKFCLPTEDNNSDFYPPNAVLAFDEIQGKFDKRNWSKLEDYYSRAWEVRRHNGYLVICASQFGNVDSNMRNLFTHVFFVEEKWQEWSKDKYSHLQSFWRYKQFNSFSDLERWLANSDLKTYIAEGVRVYDGDIRKCYDGEGFRAYWFYNRENSNYTQHIHLPIGLNVEDFKKFNERNRVV